MNTSNEGTIGEMLVIADLMRRGYEVFRATSPGCSCDLILLKGGLLIRTEVTKGQRYTAWSKKMNRNGGDLRWPKHDSEKYDLMAVWESDGVITYMPGLS